MPANPLELQEALDEGVQLKWLRTISHVDGRTLTLEKMKLDDDGKPQPTGEYEELGGDSVVLALGQDVDRSMLDGVAGVQITDGVVQVDGSMMTGAPGIFAGGDAVPSARSATVAIGHGRAAADNIDQWLTSRTPAHLPIVPLDTAVPVAFGQLNAWYYSDAPHEVRPRLDAARRTEDFSEVVGGLDEGTALYEARRCLSCGNCFGCDNCVAVCPDNAVLQIDGAHGYAIDYDYCKGCGLCAAECPCGAIVMEPEPS
jgi:2-oxoacid:acceptor oxidoreductase delta subunit (pyruvate/2-ketoisovalerate family)